MIQPLLNTSGLFRKEQFCIFCGKRLRFVSHDSYWINPEADVQSANKRIIIHAFHKGNSGRDF